MDRQLAQSVVDKLKNGQQLTFAETTLVINLFNAGNVLSQVSVEQPEKPEVEVVEEVTDEEEDEEGDSDDKYELLEEEVNTYDIGKASSGKKGKWRWLKWIIGTAVIAGLVMFFFFPGAIGLSMVPWANNSYLSGPVEDRNACSQDIAYKCSGANNFKGCCEIVFSSSKNSQTCGNVGMTAENYCGLPSSGTVIIPNFTVSYSNFSPTFAPGYSLDINGNIVTN